MAEQPVAAPASASCPRAPRGRLQQKQEWRQPSVDQAPTSGAGSPGRGPEAQVRGRHERGRGDGRGSTANPVGLWELRGSEPVRCLQLQVTEDPIRV